MEEIRFHGRGGQGAVIGSEILAHAFFTEGRYVQSFPQFGVERRGAPVTAFCRVDDKPILLRNQIYEPDHAVVLDPSLIQTGGVKNGLKENATILINGKKEPEFYRQAIKGNFRIFVIDAAQIAVEFGLGSRANPIVNTAIIGAFAKASSLLKLDSVIKAIEETVPVKKQNNIKAAGAAYEKVVGL